MSAGLTPARLRPIRSIDLPVFRADRADDALFYAPGYLVLAAKGFAESVEAGLRGRGTTAWPAVDELRRHAEAARGEWQVLPTRPFRPVCLTLYLNNECSLACSYCYADPSPRPGLRLDVPAIRAAANTVAAHCRDRSCRFTVVLHGGGEPTLVPALAEAALDTVAEVADAHGLDLFRYVATNGVMPPARAEWVAGRFDLVGLSCDGPPSIQNVQRPNRGGGASSTAIERTADILQAEGVPLHVRVTVTAESVEHLSETASYICSRLKPQEVHVEPVYQAGRARAEHAIGIEQADRFVEAFLEARRVARRHGVPWSTSGSRPAEIHSRYCNVFRDVLQVVPGGVASACFKTTTAIQTQHAGVGIGHFDADGDVFVIDSRRLGALGPVLGATPPGCDSCFNRHHCVLGCPDACPLSPGSAPSDVRCYIQSRLTRLLIELRADEIRGRDPPLAGVIGGRFNA